MLDEQFFSTHLPKIVRRFVDERGIEPAELAQRVTLRNGTSFDIVGGEWAKGWVAFWALDEDDADQEYDAIRVVPMGDILEIELGRRPAGSGRRHIGFGPAQPEPDHAATG